MWALTRAANRKIAYSNHRKIEAHRAEIFFVEQKIPDGSDQAVNKSDGIKEYFWKGLDIIDFEIRKYED